MLLCCLLFGKAHSFCWPSVACFDGLVFRVCGRLFRPSAHYYHLTCIRAMLVWGGGHRAMGLAGPRALLGCLDPGSIRSLYSLYVTPNPLFRGGPFLSIAGMLP